MAFFTFFSLRFSSTTSLALVNGTLVNTAGLGGLGGLGFGGLGGIGGVGGFGGFPAGVAVAGTGFGSQQQQQESNNNNNNNNQLASLLSSTGGGAAAFAFNFTGRADADAPKPTLRFPWSLFRPRQEDVFDYFYEDDDVD